MGIATLSAEDLREDPEDQHDDHGAEEGEIMNVEMGIGPEEESSHHIEPDPEGNRSDNEEKEGFHSYFEKSYMMGTIY